MGNPRMIKRTYGSEAEGKWLRILGKGCDDDIKETFDHRGLAINNVYGSELERRGL